MVKARENCRHLERKLESQSKSLQNARKLEENQSSTLAKIEKDLEQIRLERDKHKDAFEKESKSKGLQLNDAQVRSSLPI